MPRNVLNWFEIPVSDFERAKKFYETILNIEMSQNQMGPWLMGFFPYEQGSGELSGAIIHGDTYVPSTSGTLIYLNGNPDLTEVLNRIEPAGGRIERAKTEISPEIGYFAIFIDSEGNRVALHSQR